MTAIVLDDLDWSADAQAAIADRAKHGGRFDAYALTETGLRNPPHPNLWGAAFRAAKATGVIAWAGYHRSERPSRAGGVCSYWVGVEHG